LLLVAWGKHLLLASLIITNTADTNDVSIFYSLRSFDRRNPTLYSHKIDYNARHRMEISHKARKITKLVPELIKNLKDCCVCSSSVFNSVLMFTLLVPSKAESASYLTTKIDKHLKKNLNCSLKSAFVHNCGIGPRWRNGFNGGVIPISLEVRDINVKYNQVEKILESSDAFDMEDLLEGADNDKQQVARAIGSLKGSLPNVFEGDESKEDLETDYLDDDVR